MIILLYRAHYFVNAGFLEAYWISLWNLLVLLYGQISLTLRTLTGDNLVEGAAA
jgi:hypothetical protein